MMVFFLRFLNETKDLDPHIRGEKFGSLQELQRVHSNMATEGQTSAPEADAKVAHHFVAFVNVGGVLYEFDGGKQGPQNHGPTTETTFLKDTAGVIKREFMDKLPGEMGFSVITLGPLEQD